MPDDKGQIGGTAGDEQNKPIFSDSGPGNAENQPKKEGRKRKRRRWKKINEEISQEKREHLKENVADPDQFQPNPAEEEEIEPEAGEEDEPAAQDESEPAAQAINPFADFDFAAASQNEPKTEDLPPKQVENRYKEEENKPEDFAKEENESAAWEVSPPKDQSELVNPFEDSFVPPIEERPLEDKPLDRIAPVEEEDFGYNMEPKPEEIQENKEFIESEVVENPKNEESDEKVEVLEVQTHEKAADSLEPQVKLEHEAPKAEMEEFKSEFWEILEQAGITKKTLIWFGVAFVIGLLLIFVFIFGWFSGDNGTEEPVGETETEVVEEDGDDGDSGVVPNYIVGEEDSQPGQPIVALPISTWGNIDGVNAAFVFGGLFESEKVRFAYYTDLVNKLNNVYTTDVYLLLDQSVDRRAALESHLLQMNNLILEGQKALTEIDLIMQNLDRTYETIIVNRDLHEEQFFAFTQDLRGNSAYNSLELFIGFAQDSTRVKAYYNGYELLFNIYQNVLAVIQPRYQDIVVNKEAVIKGVRVFDVPNSDIKAIIRLSN